MQLLGSGTILREVIAGADLLASDFDVATDVWSCPSFTEQGREGIPTQRWNMLHPNEPRRASHVERCLAGAVNPDVGPGADGEQGAPVRAQCHRDGRPADRLRLVRRSRRRRHGVDDGGPYLAHGARAGYRYGDSALVDPTAHDALFCSVDMRGMGVATDFYNKAKDIGRAEQDEYAAMSHDRAGDRSKERAARRRDRRRRGAPAQG